jgi:hypothetical protein
MKFLFISFVALLPLVAGCSEEKSAEAKEFWLGIPNKTEPKSVILERDNDDTPRIAEYKKQAKAARTRQYEEMSGQRSMKLFAEKADSLDAENMRDLLHSRLSPNQVDVEFEERAELHRPAPQRRYVPMDFAQGQYGDMHRLGTSISDLGAEMSRQGAIQAERKAISEARNSLNSYILQMEKVKYSLLSNQK